jgi:hypothetical protein
MQKQSIQSNRTSCLTSACADSSKALPASAQFLEILYRLAAFVNNSVMALSFREMHATLETNKLENEYKLKLKDHSCERTQTLRNTDVAQT